MNDPNFWPQESQYQMHYRQTTDESVCCQIFPGILPWENNNDFDINNDSFWMDNPNPWQIIFDGYKKGIKPGKQGVKVLVREFDKNRCSSYNQLS